MIHGGIRRGVGKIRRRKRERQERPGLYPSLPPKFERVVGKQRDCLFNCREGDLGEAKTRSRKEKTKACKNAVWSPERVCFGAVRTTENTHTPNTYIHESILFNYRTRYNNYDLLYLT